VASQEVDPRNLAQRIMDIRSQLAEEFIQDLKQVAEENSLLLRWVLVGQWLGQVGGEGLTQQAQPDTQQQDSRWLRRTACCSGGPWGVEGLTQQAGPITQQQQHSGAGGCRYWPVVALQQQATQRTTAVALQHTRAGAVLWLKQTASRQYIAPPFLNLLGLCMPLMSAGRRFRAHCQWM
jgi:hypothetical protein